MKTPPGTDRRALASSLLLHAAVIAAILFAIRPAPLSVSLSDAVNVTLSAGTGKRHARVPRAQNIHPKTMAAKPVKVHERVTQGSSSNPASAQAPSSGGKEVATALRLYLSLVRDRLNASIRIPQGILDRPVQVTLKLTLLPDGTIVAPSLFGTSGHARIDRAILQAVRHSGPFPRFSPELKNYPKLSVSLPIEIQPRYEE